MSVSATVVEPCTIEAVNRRVTVSPEGLEPRVDTGPPHRIRCGRRTMLYPAPRAEGTNLRLRGVPVRVNVSADGRTLDVEF